MSNKSYDDYTRTYGFDRVKDKLDVYGVWHVQGEDPNCDFGGSHHQPTLGFFEGKLKDVIEYAVTLKGFWQWGGGGDFIQVTVVKVDENIAEKQRQLAIEKEQLEERLAEIKRELK